MKKITLFLLSLLAIVALISCQNKNTYTIDGSINDTAYNGKLVYLQKMDTVSAYNIKISTVDSVIMKNGKFTIKGISDGEPFLGFVSIGEDLRVAQQGAPVATIIVEPGSIKVDFNKTQDSPIVNISLSGTKLNEEFNKIHIAMNKLGALYKEVSKAGGVQGVPVDADGKDIQTKMQEVQDEMRTVTFNFTKANMANKAGQTLFFSSYSSFSDDELKELIALGDSTFRNQPEIKALEEDLNRVIPEVGQPFADVSLVDINGNRVSLSAYAGKNKCTLIDFWASWCGPCIQEMPSLAKAYTAYKAKGLEIVGISVDDDRQAWLGAVEKHNMKWIQLGDDNKQASMIYGVASIPHTILVDANGTIVAKNLRGKELEDKIAEILK